MAYGPHLDATASRDRGGVTFWRLLGPSTFVDRIEQFVRDGLNVIMRFPCRVPHGLERDLRDRLKGLFDWKSVDASYGDPTPAVLLHRQVCPDVRFTGAVSVTELAKTSAFQRRVVWVEGIAPLDWTSWSAALLEYAEACRNVELLSRTLLVVSLTGDAVAAESPEEVALVRQDFCGFVDSLDLFVFALWNAPVDVRGREQRALLAHTVAEVAQWDYFLAIRLLSLPLHAALSPALTLGKYARDQGWTPETPRCWERGTVDEQEGQSIVHSAALVASGDKRQIDQRIWAAQAAVLLPLIEEQRVGLLPYCRRYLGAMDIDIEIGPLTDRLERKDAPMNIRRQARRLRRARNKLAHMEPIPPSWAIEICKSAVVRRSW